MGRAVLLSWWVKAYLGVLGPHTKQGCKDTESLGVEVQCFGYLVHNVLDSVQCTPVGQLEVI